MGGFILIIGDTEFELALFGAEDDRLAVHPPDHVEGGFGFAVQRQLQEIGLDAGFDGFAQLGLDGKETIGRAEAFDSLVRPLVIIIFDPELDALAGVIEAAKLGADQVVLPDGGPKPFNLPEGHGMVRAGFDVGHAILLELGGEAAGAAPGDVLAAVVGEHLAGRLELGDGGAIDLDDRLGGGAAEQISADNVPGMVIEEGDEVGVAAAQPEGEDVRLPHLVGGGALEEAGPGKVLGFLFGRRRHEVGLLEPLADGGGAGGQQKPAAQQLRDAGDAEGGVLLFELHDFGGDGSRKFLDAVAPVGPVLQGVFAALSVPFDPVK